MLTTPIKHIYVALANESAHRLRYSQSWLDLSRSSLSLVTSTVPECASTWQEVCVLFSRLSAIHRELAEQQNRSSDEFRDVFERQNVVQRISDEYRNLHGAFNRASDQLLHATVNKANEQVRPSYERRERGLNDAIQRAITAKRRAADDLKAKLRELIEQRQRFGRYKLRKLKSGFVGYVVAVKAALEQEMDVMAGIEELVGKLQTDSARMPPAFQAYEREFRALVAKRPQPLKEVVGAEQAGDDGGGRDQPQEAAVEAPSAEKAQTQEKEEEEKNETE
jgi:hypothetical protein